MAPIDRALHRPEDATHDLVGHRSLEDRVGVDVHNRVAEAHEHHGHRGHADRRPGGYGEQRRRPEEHADTEVEREPAALRKDESDEAPDEAADPHGGVEVADSGSSEVEQVESESDDEYEGGARDDGLRAVHADDESQVAVAENGPEPSAGVA